MYPSPERPAFGTFVKRQVEALSRYGCEQTVLFVDSRVSRLKYLRALPEMYRLILNERFDVIHAYYGLCGCIAACQARLPVVTTYCGSDLNPGFAGTRRAPMLSVFIRILGQIAAVRSNVNFVQSEEMLKRIRFRTARAASKILTMGIDLALFKPINQAVARERLGWAPERLIVLFVSSATEIPAVKRVGLAKEVMSRVRLEIPEAELLIVSGEPQESLPYYYSAADVLLLTSASEGAPNVVREAIACDLPVVSTRVGDVDRLLSGVENCHVCADDPECLVSGVVDILRKRSRTHARHLLDNESVEKTALVVYEVYRRLGKKGSSLLNEMALL